MSGMLNKAPCPCVRCGETIEVGEGHSVKVAGKGWRYEHGRCPVVNRALDSLDAMAAALFEAVKRSVK